MKKIKLTEFDTRVLVNGLYQMRDTYPEEKMLRVNDLLRKFIGMCDGLKPGKKRKFAFAPEEKRLIIGCLMDWRNSFLSTGKTDQAEGVSELLIQFLR